MVSCDGYDGGGWWLSEVDDWGWLRMIDESWEIITGIHPQLITSTYDMTWRITLHSNACQNMRHTTNHGTQPIKSSFVNTIPKFCGCTHLRRWRDGELELCTHFSWDATLGRLSLNPVLFWGLFCGFAVAVFSFFLINSFSSWLKKRICLLGDDRRGISR